MPLTGRDHAHLSSTDLQEGASNPAVGAAVQLSAENLNLLQNLHLATSPPGEGMLRKPPRAGSTGPSNRGEVDDILMMTLDLRARAEEWHLRPEVPPLPSAPLLSRVPGTVWSLVGTLPVCCPALGVLLLLAAVLLLRTDSLALFAWECGPGNGPATEL